MIIEKTILDYLSVELDCPVLMEKPSPMPKRFVHLEKTGSRRANRVTTSTFAMQSYDETLYKSAELNEEVKDAMENIVSLDEVGSCKLNSDYAFNDISNKRYRYQCIFNITHY